MRSSSPLTLATPLFKLPFRKNYASPIFFARFAPFLSLPFHTQALTLFSPFIEFFTSFFCLGSIKKFSKLLLEISPTRVPIIVPIIVLAFLKVRRKKIPRENLFPTISQYRFEGGEMKLLEMERKKNLFYDRVRVRVLIYRSIERTP